MSWTHRKEIEHFKSLTLAQKMELFTDPYFTQYQYRDLYITESIENKEPTAKDEDDLIEAWKRGGYLIHPNLSAYHPIRKWVYQDYFMYVDVIGDCDEYQEEETILLMPTPKLEHQALLWINQRKTRAAQRRNEPRFVIYDDPLLEAVRPQRVHTTRPKQKDQRSWTTRSPLKRTI